MRRLLLTAACMAALTTACAAGHTHRTADPRATKETRALYERLFALRDRGTMIGHQDAIAYGHQRYEPGFSDLKDVTGDYPAVTGWEIGHVETGADRSLDSVYFDDMRRGIAEVHARGGISTISWHADNLLTGGSTWDCERTDVVGSLLPEGTLHTKFLAQLDRVADFLSSLKGDNGKLIPVVLRLYHEQTGSWFWWGAKQCTPEEYNKLWHMTVKYLRDKCGVHNVLYAYSPTDVADEAAYLERYPGDEYVDIVGFDLYYFGNDAAARQRYTDAMERNLAIVTSYAAKSGKLPIMAETGIEGLPLGDYFSGIIAPLMEAYPVSWILFWRNAWEADKPNHFYAPYKGHASEGDFKALIARDRILMNNDIR